MICAISGSSGVGKSTMINHWCKKFPKYGTPAETYRDIPDLSLYENGTQESQKLIRDFMFKQHKEYWSKRDTQRHIIHDRTLLDNLACTMYLYMQGQNDGKEKITDEFLHESLEITRKSLSFYHMIYFLPISKFSPVPEPTDVDLEWRKWIDAKLNFFYKLFQTNDRDFGLIPEKNCAPMEEVVGNPEERMVYVSEILDEHGDIQGGNTDKSGQATPMLFGPNGLEINQEMLDNPPEIGIEDFGFSAPNLKV